MAAAAYSAPLEKLPEGLDFKQLKLDSVIRYDAAKKLLTIDGSQHILPSEKQTLDKAVEGKSGPEYDAWKIAFDAAYARATRLSYKERLRATCLETRTTRAGSTVESAKSSCISNSSLATNKNSPMPTSPINWITSTAPGQTLAKKALNSPVPSAALDAELQEEAQKLLSLEQLQLGPPLNHGPLCV
ncbi:MAG UNVERIFIED_CONTAM: hypothetical protein LVR18_42760 [Planctomycetaceae bacterium]|jgi:hypothetical protein